MLSSKHTHYSPVFRVLITVLILLLSVSSGLRAQSLPEQYQFDLGITYEISSGKEGSLKKGEQMGIWYSKGDYSGMESPRQMGFFMVMDLKDKKMVTFMEQQKMAMVMDLSKMKQPLDDAAESQAAVEVKKTGKTETILGYSCQQYQVETEDTRSLVWLTSELGDGMGGYAQKLSGLFQGGGKMNFPTLRGVENGMLMKLITTDKKSGTVNALEAVSVNKNGRTINSSGYKVMAMPGN